MTVISMFYGIIISMYFFDNRQHKMPHIHIKYQEQEALLTIPEGELIEGELRSNKLKLVQVWIAIHRDELTADWKLAINGEAIFKIDPLKNGMMMNPRVKEVSANPDFTINLTFDNGEKKVFDVRPYLDKGIFKDLKNLNKFDSVKPFLGSIRWEGGQDFCPDTLYLESIAQQDGRADTHHATSVEI